MVSALQHPSPVNEYIAAELTLGRVAELPLGYKNNVVVNRFGVIPKRGQTNQWRPILDLSFPRGRSVNNSVSTTLSYLRYVSVEDVVWRVLQLGCGALMPKVDIKQAYRNVPIHPDDRHLLGITAQNKDLIVYKH